jgi:hypothetical protein
MAPVSSYTATAYREGDWWVVEVEGVGVTQAKRLDQVEHMARDMVAIMLDVDIDDVQVTVAPHVGPELDGLLLDVRSAADEAKRAQAKATEASRATARRLKDAGYSLRDIGVLTGVSFQRVHQLLEGTATVRGTKDEALAAARSTYKAKGKRRRPVDA